MALLADYVVTPDVFDTTSYSSDEVCRLHMQTLRDVLLTEGTVRDLRSGEWRGLLRDDGRPWNPRSKELLRKLIAQGRLVEHDAVGSSAPTDDPGWCEEALGTHAADPLSGGIIVTEPVKACFDNDPLVARVDKLHSAQWWQQRSPSVRLSRSTESYRQTLDLVLRHANSLQFIDPHLDPSRAQYRLFGELLAHAGKRSPAPLIEIHRVCYEGSGPSRRFPLRADTEYFEQRFRSGLRQTLLEAGLRANVFVWDDFHDRFLISNLMGVLLGNGFDTTTNPNDEVTWSRLGRPQSDDVQREFDKASGRHKLRGTFSIP